MVIAGTTAVAAAPPRPGQHQLRARSGRPEQMTKQTTHFSNGWRQHRSRPCWCRFASWKPHLCAHGYQEGIRQHHERAVPVPGRPTANLILVQTHVFRVFKILVNGLITNDKFCMSRTARLQLSHWRLPRSARQTSRAGVESPVTGNTEEYLPQQEAYEETTMERSASLRGTA